MQKCLVNMGNGKLVLGSEDLFGNVFLSGSIRPKVTIPDLTAREEMMHELDRVAREEFSGLSIKAKVETVAKIEEKLSFRDRDIIDDIVDCILPDIAECMGFVCGSSFDKEEDVTWDEFFYPVEKYIIDDWNSGAMDFSAPYIELQPRHLVCLDCAFKGGRKNRRNGYKISHVCTNKDHVDQTQMSDHAPRIHDIVQFESWKDTVEEDEEIETIRGELMDYFDFEDDEEMDAWIVESRRLINRVFKGLYLKELGQYRVLWYGVKQSAFRYTAGKTNTSRFWTDSFGHIKNVANTPTEFDMIGDSINYEDAEYGETELEDVGLEDKARMNDERQKRSFRLVKISETEERYKREEYAQMNFEYGDDTDDDYRLVELKDRYDFEYEDDSECDDEELEDFDWDF